MTGSHAAAVLSQVTGRPFVFEQLPLDDLPDGMRLLFDWLDRVGHQVNMPALARRFPDIRWHRFELWAAAQDWPPHEGDIDHSAVHAELRS